MCCNLTCAHFLNCFLSHQPFPAFQHCGGVATRNERVGVKRAKGNEIWRAGLGHTHWCSEAISEKKQEVVSLQTEQEP